MYIIAFTLCLPTLLLGWRPWLVGWRPWLVSLLEGKKKEQEQALCLRPRPEAFRWKAFGFWILPQSLRTVVATESSCDPLLFLQCLPLPGSKSVESRVGGLQPVHI